MTSTNNYDEQEREITYYGAHMNGKRNGDEAHDGEDDAHKDDGNVRGNGSGVRAGNDMYDGEHEYDGDVGGGVHDDALGGEKAPTASKERFGKRRKRLGGKLKRRVQSTRCLRGGWGSAEGV